MISRNLGPGRQRLRPPAVGFLESACELLGQSLNLHRNAALAVQLAVRGLATLALFALVDEANTVEWWIAQVAMGPVAGPGLVRSGRVAAAAQIGWLHRALQDVDGRTVAPVPLGRWRLPDGAEHDGAGLLLAIPCGYLRPGVLMLLRSPGQPPFDAAEQRLLTRFALLVSRAMSAALLYQEQTQIADALQAALRPDPLPTIAGMTLASAYRPALGFTRVGGDFLQVDPLPDGGALLVLGDVCGKGIEAAMASGRLRQSLRVIRRITTQPIDMLALLNDVILDADDDAPTQLATLVLGVAQATLSGELVLRLAGGGHLRPLVIRWHATIDDPAVEAVDLGGLLLGADRDAKFAEAVVWLAPGERCVLYSDGVSEAPAGLDATRFDESRLRELLAEYAHAPAAVLAERIEQRTVDWIAGAGHDDIAVLIVQAGTDPYPFDREEQPDDRDHADRP